MDLKEMMDDSGGTWTEERHSAFLNWVEESFVRQVLAARGADPGLHLALHLAASGWRPPPPPLPLDRFLPDSATESTRDLGRAARSHGAARPRRSSTAPAAEEEAEDEESTVTSRHRKRKPRPLLSRHKLVQDQLGGAKPDGIMSHENKAGEEETRV